MISKAVVSISPQNTLSNIIKNTALFPSITKNSSVFNTYNPSYFELFNLDQTPTWKYKLLVLLHNVTRVGVLWSRKQETEGLFGDIFD